MALPLNTYPGTGIAASTGCFRTLVCGGLTSNGAALNSNAVGAPHIDSADTITLSAGDSLVVVTDTLIAAGNGVNVDLSGVGNVLIGKDCGTGLDSGDGNVCIGSAISANALSADSVVIGDVASTSGSGSVTIGSGAETNCSYSVSIGRAATCDADLSVAIGNDTVSGGLGSLTVGDAANCSGERSIAIGADSSCAGDFSVAVGHNAQASSDYSIAIGQSASATHANSVAIGHNSTSVAANTIKFGQATAGNELRIFETRPGHIFRLGPPDVKPPGAFSVSVESLLNGVIIGTATGANTQITLPLGVDIIAGVPGMSFLDAFETKITNDDPINNFQFAAVVGLAFYGPNTIPPSSSRILYICNLGGGTVGIVL